MDNIKEFYDLFSSNQLQPEIVLENKSKQISAPLKQIIKDILDGSLGVDTLTIESNSWLRHVLGRIQEKNLADLGLEKSDISAASEKLAGLMTTSRGIDQILNTQLSSTIYITANSNNVHKNILGTWQFQESNSSFFAEKLKNGKVNYIMLSKNKVKFLPNKVVFDIKFGLINDTLLIVEFLNGVPKRVETFFFELTDKNSNLILNNGATKATFSRKEA